MVTALVVAQTTPLTDTVEVSSGAAGTGGGGLDLGTGDRYTVESLLYALLLTSSNDAAVALAEHVAGSERAFVREMNRLALHLGAADTRFVTSHGLDIGGHHSSARDLAVIAEELLEDPRLASIVATSATTVAGPRGKQLLENRNLLLEGYPGAIGVKTGFTAAAGNVLVAAARRQGRTLIAVAMRSEDATEDSRQLLDYGWAKLARAVIVPRGTVVGAVLFDAAGSTDVVTARPLRGPSDPREVQLRFEPRADIEAPLGAGEVVGEVLVSAGSASLASLDAVVDSDVSPMGVSWSARAISSLLGAIANLVEEIEVRT